MAELARPAMASPAPTVLEVADATKRFATQEGEIVAVQGISFDVHRGEFVSIIGPSGCGKSTLFGMIGGLVDDWQGRIRVDGAEVKPGVTHQSIGMVFQEESTFPWRTVLENVALPLEARRMARSERLDRAAHFVALVGLKGFENRYPHEISGGMRQRTAIARTLAYAPKILMMDEPFGALDEQTRLLLGDTVLRIQSELNQTILLITHSIAESVQLSDRVLIMTYRPGRLKRFVPIDLPRPRSSADVGDPRFGLLVAEIWKDLREEASRGLREMERT
ncbi:MAG TPA: ABC transporter ATP-binding protein [Acetobacteraceae bacterium]|nr:ABC transporter ATP-binding protein [Acetobacteraceae bacterium]